MDRISSWFKEIGYSKKLIIIGGAIGGAIALQYLLRDQNVEVKNIQKLKQPLKSEEYILTIMRDLKGQLFNIWVQVADIYNKVLEENKGKPELEDGRSITDIIYQEVLSLYSTKKRMICLKHELDDSELEIYVDEVYKNHEEIQSIFKEIDKCFNQSMQGKYPDISLDQEIFKEISPEKTLFLVELILRETGKRFNTVYNDLRNQGETDFSLNNPKFIDVIRNQKISDMKNQILRDYGFQRFNDTPTEVLGKLTQNYRLKEKEFALKLNRLEKQYDSLMDILTTEPFLSPNLVEKIFGPEKEFESRNQNYLKK